MLSRFDQFLEVLRRLELWASAGTVLTIVLINCANLLARWLFHRPFDWVLESSLILFVYAVMLIVPVLYRDKAFIQMHLIQEVIGQEAARYVGLLVDVLILAFLIYLLPLAINLSLGQIAMLSRGLGIPRYWVTVPVSIGTALCLPVGLSNVLHHVRDLRKKE